MAVKGIDKASVHKICSGQVILTLSTAVKELVENSLDAGATSVDVRLKGFGEESIEVSDNGSGIEKDNFRSIALKHHTSKLKEFSDLINVSTFGFRGEALSSLSALSDLSVLTRHQSCENGTKIDYDHNGEILKAIPCARQVGTTVTVRNLFKTLPVRHKEFVRNIKKEFHKMCFVLHSYCLVRSDVKFNCTSVTKNGKKTAVVNTNGNQDLLGVITNVFNHQQMKSLQLLKQLPPSAKDLEEFGISEDQVTESFAISGYISVCEHGQGRSTSDRQFYFINERPCDNSKLSRTVNEVYHQYNRHQYPFVFLDIQFKKETVDVNVTPDKRQIFVQNEKMLLATIKSSLTSLFDESTENLCTSAQSQIKLTSVSSAFKMKNFSGQSSSNSSQISFNKLKKEFVCTLEQPAKPKSAQQSKISNAFAWNKSLPSFSRNENGCTTLSDERSSKRPKFDVETNVHTQNQYFKPKQFESHPKESLSFHNVSDLEKSATKSDSDHKIHIASVLSNKHGEEPINCEADTSVDDTDCSLRLDQCGLRVNDVSLSNAREPCQNSIENRALTGPSDVDAMETEQINEVDENEEVSKKLVTVPVTLSAIKTLCKLREGHLESRGRTESCIFKAKITPDDNKKAEDELKKAISKDMFSKMDILCQFNLGFIIAKLNFDLFIIDQHASDEKYNFESLQRNTNLQTQKLIQPMPLNLNMVNESILQENLEIFRRNGFEFDFDENNKASIVSIPVCKNWTFGKDDIDELIFMLSDSPGVMCRPSRVQQMFASQSCRKSVMVGTGLSIANMKKIVCHMEEIDQPWNCPHGRPTIRHLINLDMLHSS